jgi:tRNA (guanine-N7-)-methyltransferase
MCVFHSSFLLTEHSSGSSAGASKIVAVDPEPGLNIESGKGKRKSNMSRCPKHMLNPFKCPGAVPAPDWKSVFTNPCRPLLLDIGCAKGRWVEQLASESTVRLELNGQTFNYCGVELYAPLVEMANANINREDHNSRPKNLYFVAANINTSIKSLEFPFLHTVCIQFPDPWIKKRKRRVVTHALVAGLASVLPSGGQVCVHFTFDCCPDPFTLSFSPQIHIQDFKFLVHSAK